MTQTFGDLELAAKTKEVISTIVRKEVETLRPPARYAVVTSLDPVMVTYEGDTTPVPVKTGSVVPSAIGQIVRIEGALGDRYVADVVGVNAPEVPEYEPGGSNEFPDGIIVDGEPINTDPPDTPLNIVVTEGLEFENIYWRIEWDLVAGAVEYDVEVAQKMGANVYDLAKMVRVATNVARVDGLQPFTEYGVRVRAVSNIGIRSAPTVWHDFITGGDNTVPPQIGLPVLSRGATSLIVSFDALTNLEAPDVANGNGIYEVQIDTANTFDTVNLRTSLGTQTVVAFADLNFEATWYARVRAIDTSGNLGAWSNVANLLAGRITSEQINDGAITEVKIGDDAITAPKIAANAVEADHILAGQISSDKIVTAGLDAAVIKFGTMHGDRIQANTMSVDKLTTSVLTATTSVTLTTGGAIIIGNPTTNGIYINSQGITAYKNGNTSFSIDASGNATFGGTLSAGISIVSPNISSGTIEGTIFRTASGVGSSTAGISIEPSAFDNRWIRFFGTDVGGGFNSSIYGYITYAGGVLTFAHTSGPDIQLMQGFTTNTNQINIRCPGTSGHIYLTATSVTVSGTLSVSNAVLVQNQPLALENHSHSNYSTTGHNHSQLYSVTITGYVDFSPGYVWNVASGANRSGEWRVNCNSYMYATSATGNYLRWNSSTGQVHMSTSTIHGKSNVARLKRGAFRNKITELKPSGWTPKVKADLTPEEFEKMRLPAPKNPNGKPRMSDMIIELPPTIEDMAPTDRWRRENGIQNMGLIAEDVFEVDPALAIVNEYGQPIGIDWDAVVVMLIAEVQELREELNARNPN